MNNQPFQLILNSKFARYNNGNYIFDLLTPIMEPSKARISEFTTIYLINLIQESQANLKFDIKNSTDTYNYNISLDSLTQIYYNSITDLLTDLNNILNEYFDGSTPEKAQLLKPELIVDIRKNKINFNAALNSQVQILSDFNNFWYKLGFNDGVYIFSGSIVSPSYPSIIPLAEVYIKLDGMVNESALIKSDKYITTNDSATVSIITFHNVKIGDLFYYRSGILPAYPLKFSSLKNSFSITLLNSIGNPVKINSDFRITIDFLY